MKKRLFFLTSILLFCLTTTTFSQSTEETIFDDKLLLQGYAQKYSQEPKEILFAMLRDDTLTSYKTAAVVRVFRERFGKEVVSREKKIVEKILLRRYNRNDSNFVRVEIMHTLCVLDRYKYFKSMVPELIRKLDHYNRTVNELAFKALKEEVIDAGHNRAREARIIFNTLRKVLFLSRKRLEQTTTPDIRLQQKLELLRWSIKVLGTEELKRLPKEVLHLL